MGQVDKEFDPAFALSGKLLLASPAMEDPRFNRAVIFICAHDEKGAMGLIINQKMALSFPDLIARLEVQSDITITAPARDVPVYSGGPVESSRGFLLHTNEYLQKDTVRLSEDYSLTGTLEGLKKLAEGEGPQQVLFILGHAGWTAGQLEREIQENAWIILESDQDIIFHADPKQKWDMAMARLGLDPAMLSLEAGHA